MDIESWFMDNGMNVLHELLAASHHLTPGLKALWDDLQAVKTAVEDAAKVVEGEVKSED